MVEKKNIKRNKKNKKNIILISIKLVLTLIIVGSTIYLIFYSGNFNIKNIEVEGNQILTDNDIIKLTKIDSDNIFLINEQEIRKNLLNEVYISDMKLIRKLPATININIIERVESILLKHNDQELILDFDGIPLRYNNGSSDKLFVLEINQDMDFNLGEKIELSNSDIIFENIIELIYYIDLNNYDFVEKISIKNNEVKIFTNSNAMALLDYKNDMKYQIVFTKEIINDRINQNQSILGLIDFTKGENPVYTNFDDMEVQIEK